jgi:hypothetical protein
MLAQALPGNLRPGASRTGRGSRSARLELTVLEDRVVPALPRPTIVDVIPNASSAEAALNSEPNLSVNPRSPNQVALGVFDFSSPTNPFFSSQNGGTAWTTFQNLPHGDETNAWASSGNLYASLLNVNGTLTSGTVTTSRSGPPNNPPGFVPIDAFTTSGPVPPAFPDQPWVEANTVGGQDHIYVGVNDISQFGNAAHGTAVMHWSVNSGASFQTVFLDPTAPPAGQDSPAVRTTVTGNTVYVAYSRWTGVVAGGRTATLFVRKDTNGGAGAAPFNALGPTGTAVVNFIEPFSTTLGTNRNPGSFSISVDPGNPNRVAIAYVTLGAAGGQPHLEVRLSTDGGASWSGPLLVTAAGTGLPAIAIASNGTIGLLYQRSTGAVGNFQEEVHFVQSNDSFASSQDQTMLTWHDTGAFTSLPGIPPQPTYGDYYDLVSVGGFFYGTFCAGNNLNNTASLPFGVTLQRGFTGTPGQANFGLRNGAAAVAFSMDPFFFSEQALPGPIKQVFYPLRYIYDPMSNVFYGNLTLINVGGGTAQGPFTLVFRQLPPGITLVNATGFTADGAPFITVNGSLSPFNPIRVRILLRNPFRLHMSTFFIGFPISLM